MGKHRAYLMHFAFVYNHAEESALSPIFLDDERERNGDKAVARMVRDDSPLFRFVLLDREGAHV